MWATIKSTCTGPLDNTPSAGEQRDVCLVQPEHPMPTDDLPSRVPFQGTLRTEPGRRAYLPRWAGPSRL